MECGVRSVEWEKFGVLSVDCTPKYILDWSADCTPNKLECQIHWLNSASVGCRRRIVAANIMTTLGAEQRNERASASASGLFCWFLRQKEGRKEGID